jgi:type IV pilus assembly protein PilM
MKELLSDITRSIDFFVSSGIETNISKIYLSGGISSIKGINTYIYDELKIPVSFLDPFSIVENKPANITDYVSHSLSVAAGLSLRGIEDL